MGPSIKAAWIVVPTISPWNCWLHPETRGEFKYQWTSPHEPWNSQNCGISWHISPNNNCLVVQEPSWNIYESQLGWLFHILWRKIKNVWKHQADQINWTIQLWWISFEPRPPDPHLQAKSKPLWLRWPWKCVDSLATKKWVLEPAEMMISSTEMVL